jgi:hypothetical protein
MTRYVSRAFLVAAIVSLTISSAATANIYFTDQAQPATGTFEWDQFAGSSFTSAHVPDVRNLGAGTATLAGGITTIGFAPPPMVVPGVRDLYSGSAITFFTAKIDPAIDADDFTTVVLQFTVDPLADVVPSSILMNGASPTELVDRGVGLDDLHYYWAEWQVAATTPLSATFHPVRTPQGDHFVLYGAQLDYYNGAAAFDAVAGHAIPEPATMAMAGLGLVGIVISGRRRSMAIRKA